MWKDNLKQLVKTKKFAVVAASVVSLASGGASGYILAKKSLEEKYAEIAAQEIEEAKVFYQQKNKVGEFADPEVLAQKYADEAEVESEMEKAADALEEMEEAERDEIMKSAVETMSRKLKYHTDSIATKPTPTEEAEVKISITKNVFENRDPVEEEEYDLEVEIEKRDKSRPYIITHDEFFENDSEYSMNSLTYFEGDEVLVDEKDKPIRDINKVIGTENLRFGFGSKDKNIVYIRNDELSIDFEVALSNGKYAEEVLGYIEHSDKPRPRKFRNYD